MSDLVDYLILRDVVGLVAVLIVGAVMWRLR